MDTEVTLRPIDLADLDDFYMWASDNRVNRCLHWDTFTSKEEFLNHMKSNMLPHPWMHDICYCSHPVRAISVTPCKRDDRCRGGLGYVLAWQYWGKGIVTKAVKAMLGTIFRDFEDLERVEALVDVENVGCQRVLEKSGFTKDGVLRRHLILKGKVRDMILYSFISTDPLV